MGAGNTSIAGMATTTRIIGMSIMKDQNIGGNMVTIEEKDCHVIEAKGERCTMELWQWNDGTASLKINQDYTSNSSYLYGDDLNALVRVLDAWKAGK
jgi:hypothetical protein